MINIISAVAKNRVIGYHGHIPWNIPEDMAYFKKLTTGNIIIMGRKTYEEIGKPLPDRLNIIISHTRKFSGDNLLTAQSLIHAIALAKQYKNNQEIFLCGGQEIYTQGLQYADRLYLTEIDKNYQGDVFFPEFNHKFKLVKQAYGKTSGIKFCVYQKI
ncbi:MAG: dihydrofolate reductase [Oscillospiraceae bacterium]|nr:dihydrofolate reductase [Oscillospiraceae bacterium]